MFVWTSDLRRRISSFRSSISRRTSSRSQLTLRPKSNLSLHLQEHVLQRVVRVVQELDGVGLGLEQCPEAHQYGREAMLVHHDLWTCSWVSAFSRVGS